LGNLKPSLNDLPSVFDSDSDSEESEEDVEENSDLEKVKILRMIKNLSNQGGVASKGKDNMSTSKRKSQVISNPSKGKFRDDEEMCEDPFEIVVEDDEADEDLFESISTSPKTRHSSTLSSTSTASSSASISTRNSFFEGQFDQEDEEEEIDQPIFTQWNRKLSLSPFSPLVHPRYPTLSNLFSTSPPYSPDSALSSISILSSRYQRTLKAFEIVKSNLPHHLNQDEKDRLLEDSKEYKEAVRSFWEVKRWMERRKLSEMNRWKKRQDEIRLGRMVVGYEQELCQPVGPNGL
jgi:hypothetical protein